MRSGMATSTRKFPPGTNGCTSSSIRLAAKAGTALPQTPLYFSLSSIPTASGRPVPESGESRSGRTAQKKAASATASKRTLSDLSDDELRQRISRLELEKRYKDLEKADAKPKSTRGRDFCVNVLETIGKNTLTNIGTQAANHVLGEAINKLAGVSSDDKAHRVVNPQKGQEDKK